MHIITVLVPQTWKIVFPTFQDTVSEKIQNQLNQSGTDPKIRRPGPQESGVAFFGPAGQVQKQKFAKKITSVAATFVAPCPW